MADQYIIWTDGTDKVFPKAWGVQGGAVTAHSLTVINNSSSTTANVAITNSNTIINNSSINLNNTNIAINGNSNFTMNSNNIEFNSSSNFTLTGDNAIITINNVNISNSITIGNNSISITQNNSIGITSNRLTLSGNTDAFLSSANVSLQGSNISFSGANVNTNVQLTSVNSTSIQVTSLMSNSAVKNTNMLSGDLDNNIIFANVNTANTSTTNYNTINSNVENININTDTLRISSKAYNNIKGVFDTTNAVFSELKYVDSTSIYTNNSGSATTKIFTSNVIDSLSSVPMMYDLTTLTDDAIIDIQITSTNINNATLYVSITNSGNYTNLILLDTKYTSANINHYRVKLSDIVSTPAAGVNVLLLWCNCAENTTANNIVTTINLYAIKTATEGGGSTPVDNTNIFIPYNNTLTYDVGDVRYYNGYIYKCNTPITVPENFDSSKWTQTSVTAELSNLIKFVNSVVNANNLQF